MGVFVIASNLTGYTHVRLIVRKGRAHIQRLGWLGENVCQPPSAFVHGDNVYTSVASSSDRRLKSNLTEVSGTQALRVLSGISCQTYDAFEEHRLGLIADEVQTSVEELAIDYIVGSTILSKGEGEPPREYLTLQYERLVPLLIASVNSLSQRVKYLESKYKWDNWRACRIARRQWSLCPTRLPTAVNTCAISS